MRKSDGREEGRQGEHGVDLNADRKDVALPSRMARCERRERGKKTPGKAESSTYHLRGLGEPFKAMKNESKTDGGNRAFKLFTHRQEKEVQTLKTCPLQSPATSISFTNSSVS